ncbi:hypothetical protein [Vibrio gazogenes]|nr:hypothetical protein [Vibrio gazogenes]
MNQARKSEHTVVVWWWIVRFERVVVYAQFVGSIEVLLYRMTYA